MVDQQAAPPEPHGPRATPGRGPHPVPVRVYEGDGRLMVAAPLPGLEPPDITVTVRGDRVVIHGEGRGPRQDARRLHLAEWSTGPYHREVTLPQAVDGARANATYGNGVLVVALPKASTGAGGAGGGAPTVAFRLEVGAAPRGARVGHAGRDLHRTSTAEHRQRLAETAQRAGAAGAGAADRPPRLG
jgi:HSP20 family protein